MGPSVDLLSASSTQQLRAGGVDNFPIATFAYLGPASNAKPTSLLNGVIPPEHPLHYADVPALVKRLKLFFTFEVRSTAGRTDVAVSADNIRGWRSSTSRKNETLNMVACEMRTVLNFSADGRQGAYEQLKILSNFLITELGLKSEVKPKEKHCAPEIKLLYDDMLQRLVATTDAVTVLQRMATGLLCFVTDLRIGSLMMGDGRDQSSRGLRSCDLVFTQTERGAWSLELTIGTLKGFQQGEERVVIRPLLMPLHRPGSVLLEPMVLLLALLANRRALREHGPDGTVIESMRQLFTSDAHRFVGSGTDPVFQVRSRSGTLEAMTVSNAAFGLSVHTSALGLPSASHHSFRHDFARLTRQVFDADTARTLLTHGYRYNTL
ncbi:uncharacterized conserved coiled-coil protein [Moesziomyces antarcticus T-34]|uniref:Uncharacterized conserved coiled-coil protein n=1 Tax=Pseudozyma antarctica (strain T-34) TaxID=1151754 RepID=M9MID9_PSEA3|nr:uncharacterized conserved coiled-coil protein [Moesziomyces antarcticus T-34]